MPSPPAIKESKEAPLFGADACLDSKECYCCYAMNSSKGGRGSRRKQHGRAQQNAPRRKHKKPPPSDGGVEEQLRLQRRKKRALEQEKTTARQTHPKAPATLGQYTFDAERNVYFPADSFTCSQNKKRAIKQTTSECRRNYTSCANTKCLLSAGVISCQSLRYAMEISPSTTRQHNLRSIWAGRLLRTGMRVVPTSVSSLDGTRLLSMLPPLKTNSTSTSDTGLPLDFVCKTRLHPSARTFDVCMGEDPTMLPSIATLVDGGSHVMFGHKPQVWTVQDEQPTQSHYDNASLRISPVPDSG